MRVKKAYNNTEIIMQNSCSVHQWSGQARKENYEAKKSQNHQSRRAIFSEKEFTNRKAKEYNQDRRQQGEEALGTIPLSP